MPVLAYWTIRGRIQNRGLRTCIRPQMKTSVKELHQRAKLAEPARLLLHYVGEEFEDKQYDCGPAPEFNKDCWFGVKNTLGLDFPNLPYYIDGDIKITQSNAILRWIGRKHNLCGTTDLERSRVDMMADQAMDFRNGLVRLCYNPKAESMLEAYLTNLKPTLDAFEKFLGDRPFFCADTPTFPDFHMYELLSQHRLLFKDSIKGSAKLKDFMDRMEAFPSIKKYLESAKPIPCNNKMAVFGNK